MIRPLDLQTMYMNLDKVGKELAQTRENLLQQQIAHAQKVQKLQEQADMTVTQTEPGADSEESARIRDDEHEAPTQQKGSGEPQQDKEKEPQGKEKNTWKDPKLGRHVDLSG